LRMPQCVVWGAVGEGNIAAAVLCGSAAPSNNTLITPHDWTWVWLLCKILKMSGTALGRCQWKTCCIHTSWELGEHEQNQIPADAKSSMWQTQPWPSAPTASCVSASSISLMPAARFLWNSSSGEAKCFQLWDGKMEGGITRSLAAPWNVCGQGDRNFCMYYVDDLIIITGIYHSINYLKCWWARKAERSKSKGQMVKTRDNLDSLGCIFKLR